MKSKLALGVLGILLLAISAEAQQTPFPLMVNTWGYAAGAVSGWPAGIANWPNGEGSLTVTGSQGATTLTINSINVGVISDYQLAANTNGWAVVVLGDDGVYRVYTVYAINASTGVLSIYPSLYSSVTSGAAANLYDAVSSVHLTTTGFYGLADYVVSQTKGASYIQAYAARYVSDGLGHYSGTPWTAIGGLSQGSNGYLAPTNCMTAGVFTYTNTIDHVICNAYSGNDRTEINGSTYHTLIGAAVAGEGASLTANLNGKSGYLDTMVGIEGQYQSEEASARVVVTIDGTVVLNQNFGGISHIQVPFTHAQTGEIDVTVDSSYPCAPRISNTNWYVWNDSDWNGVSPSDPLIPNGAKVLLLMDSWGTWHNAAFGARLAHDLPGASILNTSQPGTTAAWAITNFNALSTGGPYDYIISDFQINDLKADVIGGLTDVALLNELKTLWGMVLQSGATPIYLRSLPTATTSETQRLNLWDQSLTALYPTLIAQQQSQTITFPNPGTQPYGVAPITLTASASSGLPVTYRVISGAASLNGSVLSITGAGSVTVEADQAGNSNWLAAPPVQDTFNVNPAVLTVTANSASMTYGGTVPALSASYSGFVNGDGTGVLNGSPSLTMTANSGSPVGSYPITASQGTLSSPNYTFVFVNGVLTINPAILLVAANNAATVYGQLPALSYSVTGFVNGDTLSILSGGPIVTTGATQTSPPGLYAITISQGTLGAQNYTFSFVNGVLTVQQAGSTVTLTSVYSTLSPTQSTGLTAIVTIAGGGGAPTGSVNFMLGTSLLGTGVLTATDGTDSTATMTLNGSQLQPGANNVTAVYSGDTDYTGSTSTPVTITLLTNQLSFNSVAVGATSPVQSVTYVFANDVTLSGIDILTAGVPGLDYGDGGSTTCVVGNPYIAGQSCTVSVAFTPSAASVRPGAVELFAQGSNLPLTTWYLTGIGSAPAVTIDPGTQSTLASIPNGAAQGSAIDGAGNLYVGDNANGQIIKVATTTFTQSTVATNLSQPTSVALDGAGNLYIAESNGVVMIPNENGTLNQTDMVTLSVSGLGTPQGVAIDSLGNVFITDVTGGNVIEVPANGGAQSTVASGLTNPHAVAVDSNGNVYVASDNQVAEYPASGGTPALLGTGYNTPNGVTVDASGTVYVADTGNAQIVKVSAGGGSQTVLSVAGITAPQGVTVDSSGNAYVSDGNNLLEVNRTQAAALSFGSIPSGGISPAQTLSVSNVGTQVLTVSSLTLSSSFQQQASGGTDCSGTSQVVSGANCAIAVAFAPNQVGTINGTVTLNDNALNNSGSVQSVALSGTGTQSQQQAQSITFGPLASQTYGALPFGLSATASSGLPVSFSVISGPASLSGNTLTITGAGVVTIEADQSGNNQWLPAPPVQQTFSVSPAVLTVTANNASMTYGGTLPTFSASYSGFQNGDGPGVLSGAPSLTTTATSSSPVGQYAITAAQGTLAAQNYTFVLVDGSLMVCKATLTVTANNASMTYGGTLPAFSASYSGFQNGDDQGALTGSPNLTTTATSTSPVGSYPITAAQGTLAAQNYTFVFVNGSLMVCKATLTVTANNASMTYGGTLPSFTAGYSGFQNGDGQGVLSGAPSLTTTATSSSPAGSYPITAAQGTLTAQNYTFVFVSGSLMVCKATLTVTANNTSMTYGGTLPALTASYSGFQNGDSQGVLSGAPSLTTTATSSSPVGSYPITAAQGTLAAQNYTFVFVNGSLAINQALLTVSANNLSVNYGSQLPQLTYTVTGFVNGDTLAVLSGAPVLSTTATNRSLPGTYPITITQGTLAGTNYSFTFVNGALTIVMGKHL